METMSEPAIKERIVEGLDYLSAKELAGIAVLVDAAKQRDERHDEPNGRRLLKYAGMWDEKTVQAFADEIEEGCEQVDPDGW